MQAPDVDSLVAAVRHLNRAKAVQSILERSAAVREVFPCQLRNRYGTEARNCSPSSKGHRSSALTPRGGRYQKPDYEHLVQGQYMFLVNVAGCQSSRTRLNYGPE